MAPKIGKIPFAAFLKNSLRDLSSSLFSFLFITLEVLSCLPNSLGQQLIIPVSSWKQKKAWELLLPPIPEFWPSHCLCAKMSNAASPRLKIIYTAKLSPIM